MTLGGSLSATDPVTISSESLQTKAQFFPSSRLSSNKPPKKSRGASICILSSACSLTTAVYGPPAKRVIFESRLKHGPHPIGRPMTTGGRIRVICNPNPRLCADFTLVARLGRECMHILFQPMTMTTTTRTSHRHLPRALLSGSMARASRTRSQLPRPFARSRKTRRVLATISHWVTP